MNQRKNSSPVKFIWISIVASIITITLKMTAWWMTDSVSLLSDALESFVNLFAAIIALVALTIALRPPDHDHPFGHHKAEYFSSITEGLLILIAAVSIGYTAVIRFIYPIPIESIGNGILVSVLATAVNLVTAQILFRGGRKYRSITLEADAHHLMTDVYTTGGVILGLLLVHLTGWVWLDPIIAIAVAINIIFTGLKLIARSVAGLMDEALPPEDIAKIEQILNQYTCQSIQYHALYTRKASSLDYITFHLLVPGTWTVNQGHELTKSIERDLFRKFPQSHILIHLEPNGDPESFDDYLDKTNNKIHINQK
jgi:cation diffusion facilitator family transporter